MLNAIRNIHIHVKKIMHNLETRGPFNLPWIILILWILIFLGGIEKTLLNIVLLNNVSLSLTGIYLFSLMFYCYVVKSKLPRFISKKHDTPLEMLKDFSHKSFLYGLCWVSFILTIPILATLNYLEFAVTGTRNGSTYFAYIFEGFYFAAAAFTICWFSYHVVIRNVQTKEAKVQLNLYLAVSASISFLIVSPLFGFFKTIITVISIAFAWVNYIIALKEKEEKDLQEKEKTFLK